MLLSSFLLVVVLVLGLLTLFEDEDDNDSENEDDLPVCSFSHASFVFGLIIGLAPQLFLGWLVS